MGDERAETDDHVLPSVEAAIACTLALMTGYGQAFKADQHPGRRLALGVKVAAHLDMLSEHPLLSDGFREVASTLQRHWCAMAACTLEAAEACCEPAGSPPGARAGEAARLELRPPKRLH